ncbi:MAG: HAD family hydrolase [Clostridiales bacterium]|nr:HAD family hydrolase [Clostridiales bacterium]
MQIKLAIFDFDGTIADTREAIIVAKQETMRIYGLPVADEAACASTIGYTAKAGFQRLYPDLEGEKLEQCVATYRQLFEEKKKTIPPKLFPGMIETLEALVEKGITCTIATARNQVSCHEMLEQLGVKKYFGYILCGESTQNLKPHPEAVLKTLSDLDCRPEEAIVVGDMPMDIGMGKGAGVTTCGVTYGNASRETLLEAGADFVFDEIGELLGILGN